MGIPIIGAPKSDDFWELLRQLWDRGYTVVLTPNPADKGVIGFQLLPRKEGMQLKPGAQGCVPIAELPKALDQAWKAILAHYDAQGGAGKLGGAS